MTLYSIEATQREIIEALTENEGIVTPELEALMIMTRENLETKAVGYALAIKENDAAVDQINMLITDLQAKKKRYEKTSDTLKERILAGIKLFEVEKVKTPIVNMWIGSSKRLEILDESKVPAEYIIEIPATTEIDNKALKAALENGLVTDAAKITTHQNIQIR